MLTRLSKTVKGIAVIALWAVFFTTVTASDTSLFRLENSLSELIYLLSRSVVTVESSTPVLPGSINAQSIGAVRSLVSSGIVYDLHGHILASAAAVSGRERITVRFGDEVLPAQVRGIDHQTGLAVLHVNRRIGVPASFGRYDGCAGQMVVAMGNAYGVQACPSLGFCAGSRPDGSVQFSAPITSGTVGGGVFDLSGNLLGVITGGLGSESRPDMGLAIPADRIPDIVRHLLIQGDRPVGYIGVSTADIEIAPGIEIGSPGMMVSALAAPQTVVNRGVMVTAVVPRSPAARAGLRQGDVLLRIDGALLSSALDLRNRVRQTDPGSQVEFGFVRSGRWYTVRVQIGQLQADSFEAFSSQPEYALPRQRLEDSLRSEIKALKAALQRLEQQLERLR